MSEKSNTAICEDCMKKEARPVFLRVWIKIWTKIRAAIRPAGSNAKDSPAESKRQKTGIGTKDCSLFAASARSRARGKGCLRGFFCYQGGCGFSCLQSGRLRSHNFHFVPVVAKFSTAIQARNICASPLRYRTAARASANRYRKAISCVPATKHSIHQLRKHLKTLHRTRSAKTGHYYSSSQ